MHTLKFYPLGNADSCLIQLTNGRTLLFDFADVRTDEDEDKRIDLGTELRNDLGKRTEIDVVAFTHADDDHVHGASEMFYFEHAKKYQDAGRLRISELWVPAGFILEEGLTGDSRVIRQEARHRLLKGDGIRVFSRPDALADWLSSHGVKLKERAHLIVDAGQVVPGMSVDEQDAEFFVHSPFAVRTEEQLEDRNTLSLVFQATFRCRSTLTRVLLSGDTPNEVWSDIVKITKSHEREERLSWDVLKVPHHCSYLSLGPDKGKEETVPNPEVAWLLDQAGDRAIVVSPSNPIPDDDSVEPPHRQAAKCYRGAISKVEGTFVVTMEHPTISNPTPIIIEICHTGAILRKPIGGIPSVVGRRSPRAGMIE